MGEKTKIEWTATPRADGTLAPGYTFNPWRGCQKVSPGCLNCYAEQQAKRNPKVLGEWGPEGKRSLASESYWKLPLKWNRAARAAGERRRVFCASLADVFEDRPELVNPRLRLFDLIRDTENLDWLLLTKRPENIARLWPRFIVHDRTAGPWQQRWTSNLELGIAAHNIWLGVSVEDQARTGRIDLLRQIPARVRFLSLEPLLEDLGKVDLSGIHWVIIGGESGRHARPCNIEWIRDLVRQCQAAGVACFVKQLGAHVVTRDGWPHETGDVTKPQMVGDGFGHYRVFLRDPKGGDMNEFPEDLRVREFPDV